MSSLLELIVRRRRASAYARLGPPERGQPSLAPSAPDPTPASNGHAPAVNGVAHVNVNGSEPHAPTAPPAVNGNHPARLPPTDMPRLVWPPPEPAGKPWVDSVWLPSAVDSASVVAEPEAVVAEPEAAVAEPEALIGEWEPVVAEPQPEPVSPEPPPGPVLGAALPAYESWLPAEHELEPIEAQPAAARPDVPEHTVARPAEPEPEPDDFGADEFEPDDFAPEYEPEHVGRATEAIDAPATISDTAEFQPPTGVMAAVDPEPATDHELATDAGPATDGEPEPGPDPGFRQRGRMRRRARYLRRLREVQLRDIGGFQVELYRFGADRPEIVASKIQNALQTDRELRALERALDNWVPLRELREPGIGGACSLCGAVHGSQDRYCSTCGEPLSWSAASAADAGDARDGAPDAAPDTPDR
jgi:hypothetical protein